MSPVALSVSLLYVLWTHREHNGRYPKPYTVRGLGNNLDELVLTLAVVEGRLVHQDNWPWAGGLPTFFVSVLKRLIFRLDAQKETGNSQKFQYSEKLWFFRQGLRRTEGIFSCLRTEQVLGGEKGLMGCRNGHTRYFDGQTRILAPWKIHCNFLPGLQRNQEKVSETLNQAEGDG